eukprot:CAMPEP_0181413286 /NCGR_PEP_ID=MMETSP1110-20121109/8891_1 /TAXON_ID=174948 /ORGANISM="Symbiodinium sp., Strain CCMP421" /LENGTH=370 /DNA_ID=CAMNT_0023536089 /DNA_START=80 /DNA_END=1195 /DNA_ORIENTATION=-
MTGASSSQGSAMKVRTSMVGIAAASNSCSAAALLSVAAARMAAAAAAAVGRTSSSLGVSSKFPGRLPLPASVESLSNSSAKTADKHCSAAAAFAFMTANAARYSADGSSESGTICTLVAAFLPSAPSAPSASPSAPSAPSAPLAPSPSSLLSALAGLAGHMPNPTLHLLAPSFRCLLPWVSDPSACAPGLPGLPEPSALPEAPLGAGAVALYPVGCQAPCSPLPLRCISRPARLRTWTLRTPPCLSPHWNLFLAASSSEPWHMSPPDPSDTANNEAKVQLAQELPGYPQQLAGAIHQKIEDVPDGEEHLFVELQWLLLHPDGPAAVALASGELKLPRGTGFLPMCQHSNSTTAPTRSSNLPTAAPVIDSQ